MVRAVEFQTASVLAGDFHVAAAKPVFTEFKWQRLAFKEPLGRLLVLDALRLKAAVALVQRVLGVVLETLAAARAAIGLRRSSNSHRFTPAANHGNECQHM